MIITRISNGLGNQMFQYAAGRALAIKKRTKLKLDISSYENHKNITERKYGLGCYNIISDIASEKEIKAFYFKDKSLKLYRLFNKNIQICFKEKSREYDSSINNLMKDAYLNGFWQSEKYFLDIRDILLKDFLIIERNKRIKELEEYISSVNSVSVHIRRGDYVTNPRINSFFGTCPIKYYHDAIKHLEKKYRKMVFFFFSDDIEWVKEKLKISHKSFYVDNKIYKNRNYEDLYLMSLCKNNIIANSSFSWWGAWLNKNDDKSVVAPKIWYKNLALQVNDKIPENWIKL